MVYFNGTSKDGRKLLASQAGKRKGDGSERNLYVDQYGHFHVTWQDRLGTEWRKPLYPLQARTWYRDADTRHQDFPNCLQCGSAATFVGRSSNAIAGGSVRDCQIRTCVRCGVEEVVSERILQWGETENHDPRPTDLEEQT